MSATVEPTMRFADRIRWSDLIPAREWVSDRAALAALEARGVTFALGGGLAFSAYSGRFRNTKDVDLYILPEQREAAIEAIGHAGFEDYFVRAPYDRRWIFRAYRDGVILDLIWQMANFRAVVDEVWLDGGAIVTIRDATLRLVPVEELIWSKLYVVQRERCDWTDVLNLLDAQGPDLDWRHLLARVGEDAPLLAAVAGVFGWLRPDRARELPAWIWRRLGLAGPGANARDGDASHRVALLDSRDWFGPNVDGTD